MPDMKQTLLNPRDRFSKIPQADHANEASANILHAPLKRRETSVDWAYRTLFRAIVSLRLAPGEKLSRKVLAKWLGVSLTPLRDALLRLEHQGLIETKAQSETRVALLDASDLHCLQFERVAMETEVAHRLARRKDAPLQKARAALAAQRAALGTAQSMAKLDLAFHESLFAAVGLVRAFERLQLRHAHLERCLHIAPPTSDALVTGRDFHQQILDRIDARDGNGAAAAMRAHLSDDAAAIGRALRSHPQFFN